MILCFVYPGCAGGQGDHSTTPGPAYVFTEAVTERRTSRVVRYIPTFTRSEYFQFIWTEELFVFR